VPGSAGVLGHGHPGVQPERHRRVAQVIRAAAERGALLGRGEDLLAGVGPDLVLAGVLQDAAPGYLEDLPVEGRAEPLDVGARNGSDFTSAASMKCPEYAINH
jgi:hypothetical protein